MVDAVDGVVTDDEELVVHDTVDDVVLELITLQSEAISSRIICTLPPEHDP